MSFHRTFFNFQGIFKYRKTNKYPTNGTYYLEFQKLQPPSISSAIFYPVLKRYKPVLIHKDLISRQYTSSARGGALVRVRQKKEKKEKRREKEKKNDHKKAYSARGLHFCEVLAYLILFLKYV